MVRYNRLINETKKGGKKVDVKALKIAMMKNDESQTSLARKIGMSPNTLSSRINGKTKFRIDEIERICDALNVGSKDEKAEIFLD